MKLYGFGPTRTIRVQWMLQELELDFEYVPVDVTKGEHRQPEFLALNPAGKVPVLVDDDLALSESVAIAASFAEGACSPCCNQLAKASAVIGGPIR